MKPENILEIKDLTVLPQEIVVVAVDAIGIASEPSVPYVLNSSLPEAPSDVNVRIKVEINL